MCCQFFFLIDGYHQVKVHNVDEVSKKKILGVGTVSEKLSGVGTVSDYINTMSDYVGTITDIMTFAILWRATTKNIFIRALEYF